MKPGERNTPSSSLSEKSIYIFINDVWPSISKARSLVPLQISRNMRTPSIEGATVKQAISHLILLPFTDAWPHYYSIRKNKQWCLLEVQVFLWVRSAVAWDAALGIWCRLSVTIPIGWTVSPAISIIGSVSTNSSNQLFRESETWMVCEVAEKWWFSRCGPPLPSRASLRGFEFPDASSLSLYPQRAH